MALAVAIPDTLEVLLGEVLDLTIDMTNVMGPGDVISNPIVTMTSSQVNETTPTAISTPTVVGVSTIDITMNTSKLRPKTTYDLQFNCTASGGGTNKAISAILSVVVVQ